MYILLISLLLFLLFYEILLRDTAVLYMMLEDRSRRCTLYANMYVFMYVYMCVCLHLFNGDHKMYLLHYFVMSHHASTIVRLYCKEILKNISIAFIQFKYIFSLK